MIDYKLKPNYQFCLLKVVKDGLTAEKASAKVAEMKRVQAGDVSYEENSDAMASHARLEVDGITAEKSLVKAKVCSTYFKSNLFHVDIIADCFAQNCAILFEKIN